jgi:hypothetical protein
MTDPTRILRAAGALLFLLGMLTGILISGQASGLLPGDQPAMIAAHMTGIISAFWLFLLAGTYRHIRLTSAWLNRMVILTLVAAYASWLVTTVKSLVSVRGIRFTGDATNDAVFGVLSVLVVVPTLVAAVLWVVGLTCTEHAPST